MRFGYGNLSDGKSVGANFHSRKTKMQPNHVCSIAKALSTSLVFALSTVLERLIYRNFAFILQVLND